MSIDKVLPLINASLNFFTFILLLLAFYQIKIKNISRHKFFMCLALFTSSLFLANYLYYHFNFPPVLFKGTGGVRVFYFCILITHIILAVLIVPMVLRTFWLGYKRKDDMHKKWARLTFPLWLYVSITGIMIYIFLYVLF